MNSDELRAVLETAGLSPYQADAYVVLLDRGSASASDLATASGVPQPRIYDVLRGLEDAGYVTTYDRDRLYARANDPAEALSGVRTAVERFETAIEEVETRYREATVEGGGVSIVRRRRTVFEHARETVADATAHIQVAATPEEFRRLEPALRGAYERDVQVQLSLHVPPDDDAPDPSTFEGACTDVRRRELPGPFLLLADRQRACYATYSPHSEGYGVLVDDYATAYVFHWYFLTRLWEVYDEVYTARTDDPPFDFVEITDCVRWLEPVLDDGAVVRGRVEGEFVRTGEPCAVAGEFVGVEYTGRTDDQQPASLLELAAAARVFVATDDREYAVGGRGAHEEDIAGSRFVIETVESD